VQDEETARRLGAVDRELIEQRLRAIFERRIAGDVVGLLAFLAEDAVYDLKGCHEAFPFDRPARGKKMVAKALDEAIREYQMLDAVIHQIFFDGDRVALWRTSKIRHRGTGKSANIDFANFIRFRDGLVVEFIEILDSAACMDLSDS